MTTNSVEDVITACARIFSRELAKELKRAGFGDTPSIQIPPAPETSKKQGRCLIAVNDWNKHHPHPSTSGLRWLIFHAEQNGFNQVIRRMGRRVYIDEQEFFNWVDTGRT